MRRPLSTADQWGPILVAAALILAAWIVAHNEISELTARSRAQALSNVTEVSTSYANNVGSTVKLVDSILRFVSQYDVENGAERTQSMVKRTSLYVGVLGNLAIVDAHGNGVATGSIGWIIVNWL